MLTTGSDYSAFLKAAGDRKGAGFNVKEARSQKLAPISTPISTKISEQANSLSIRHDNVLVADRQQDSALPDSEVVGAEPATNTSKKARIPRAKLFLGLAAGAAVAWLIHSK